MKTRRRSAEHLDAIELAHLHIAQLALPIGERLRDSVEKNLHTTNSKGGASAKAPNGNTQILRVVIAIRDQETGNRGERFVEAEGGAATMELVATHRRYGEGECARRRRGARDSYGDGRELSPRQ
jgi:hypothetical protein